MVTKAAEAADINRATHYDWLHADPEYKAQFEKVQEQAVQTLEDEAIRRAYHGTQRPVTVAGKRELVTEYSDVLLIFLLKGARPAKYRDNVKIDVQGEVDLAAVLRERFARQAEPPLEAVAAATTPLLPAPRAEITPGPGCSKTNDIP